MVQQLSQHKRTQILFSAVFTHIELYACLKRSRKLYVRTKLTKLKKMQCPSHADFEKSSQHVACDAISRQWCNSMQLRMMFIKFKKNI